MSSLIMQGTTPSITIQISPDDFLLSNVTAIELYMKNGNRMLTYKMTDLVIDTEANTLTKVFSEAETIKLQPKHSLIIQGRFWLGTSVVGINKLVFDVADMMGVGADG